MKVTNNVDLKVVNHETLGRIFVLSLKNPEEQSFYTIEDNGDLQVRFTFTSARKLVSRFATLLIIKKE